MDALSLFKSFRVAMEREYDAEKFYSNLASRTENKELKKLFEDFATEEVKRYDRLAELYESMKGEIGPPD